MTTTAGLIPPRDALVVQKKKARTSRSVRVRWSYSRDVDSDADSESESYTRRAMRRGKRGIVREQASTSSLTSPRQLRRRQVAAPVPAPGSGEVSDDEDTEDDEESEEDDDGEESEEDEDDEDESESSDSSDSSDSESDSSDEEEEAQPSPGTGAPRPSGFVTLVPGASNAPALPSQEEASATAPVSSTIPSDSASIESALPTVTQPTESATEESQSSETLVNEGPLPDSDSVSSVLEAPSTIVNGGDAAAPTGDSSTENPASTSQISDGDSGGPRGQDIGIVIGTLALAGLLIAAAVFFFRKRRQSNMDHLERLPDEKSLPPEPPTFRLSAPPPVRVQRSDSSVMDEAILGAYQNENGYGQDYAQNDLNRNFQQPTSYEYQQNTNGGMAAGVAPVSPVSPSMPAAANNGLSPTWVPASPRTQMQQQQQQQQDLPMSNFQLYPATNPPPVTPLPPPPAVRFNQGPTMSSNQQRFDQPRMSMTQTETTEGEGTWSTFAVERMRANGGKLPLKERVLGHF